MLKLQCIGNLGQDAIIRHYNGKLAISFSIAYNEKYKDKKGNQHERTTWVNCTMWREKETSLVTYLKKGQLVFVEGIPLVNTYVSKKTGEVVPDLQLNVKQLRLLGGANNPSNQQQSQQQQQNGTTQPANGTNGNQQPLKEEIPEWVQNQEVPF